MTTATEEYVTVEVPGQGEVEFPASMSRDEISLAIRRDLLGESTEPGVLSRAASAVGDTARRATGLITEGVPNAVQAFVQSQTAPTLGQELRRRGTTAEPVLGGPPVQPSFLNRLAFGGLSPLPALADIGERAMRLPSSIGRAVAELGPEQAKPLTQALVEGGQMAVLPPSLGGVGPRALVSGLANDLRGLVQRPIPAAPPVLPRLPLALPPGVYEAGASPFEPFVAALQQPRPLALPPGRYELPSQLPSPQAPPVPRIPDVPITPKRPYQPAAPVLTGAPPAEGLLVDELGRPVQAPAVVERESLRQRFRTPLSAESPAPATVTREVEGIGRVEFPASMTADEIDVAIARDLAGALPSQAQVVEARTSRVLQAAAEAERKAVLAPKPSPLVDVPGSNGTEFARAGELAKRQAEQAPPPILPTLDAEFRALGDVPVPLHAVDAGYQSVLEQVAKNAADPAHREAAGKILEAAREYGQMQEALMAMWGDLKDATPGSRTLFKDRRGRTQGLREPSTYPPYMGAIGVERTRQGADKAMAAIDNVLAGNVEGELERRTLTYARDHWPEFTPRWRGGVRDESGFMSLEVAGGVARAALGGAIGGQIGDTPEERVKNALIGAGLGVVASRNVVQRVMRWAANLGEAGSIGPRPPSAGQRIREQLRQGKSLDQAMADAGVVPTVSKSGPARTVAEAMEGAATTAIPKPLMTAEGVYRAEVESGQRLPASMRRSLLSHETTQKVIAGAEQAMASGGIPRDPNMPITLQVVRMVERDPAAFKGLKAGLSRSGATLDDLASMFMATASDAGRQLQSLSALSRRLADVPELRALGEALQRQRPPLTGWDLAGNYWSRAIDIWRGAITSALATTVRNVETQVVRFPMEAIEKAVEGSLRAVFRLGPGSERGLSPALQHVMETFTALTKRGSRNVVDDVLRAFPEERDALFWKWSADAGQAARRPGMAATTAIEKGFRGAERAVDVVTTLNAAQEYFTRKVAFRVRLAEKLRARGLDIDRARVDQIPVADVADAVEHALRLTYASDPKQGPAKWLMDIYGNPVGKTLAFVAPFPRFMFNAWRFLFDYSPAGFLKLVSPAERARIAAGDLSTVSKATIGAGLQFAAWQLRNSEYAGEKWYELRSGDQRIDMRPFAPFASYLFLAEAAKRARGGELSKTDARELVSGVLPSFRAGAGMFLLDNTAELLSAVSEGRSLDKGTRTLRRFFGEIVGGLAQPVTTVRDLYADYGRFLTANGLEEAKLRDLNESPFLGPTMRRIPGVSQLLPERQLPLRGATPTQESVAPLGLPLSRQISGLSVQSRTPLEAEVARLALTKREIEGAPTGEPRADALIRTHQGPLVETTLGALVQSDAYRRLTDAERRVHLVFSLEGIRDAARAKAFKDDPALFKALALRRSLHPRIEELLKERGQLPAGVR